MARLPPLYRPAFAAAPTTEDLVRLAERALAEIPPALARHVHGVGIVVEEFPDEETERDMGLESPYDILGLYRGRPLNHRSAADVPQRPDMIFLYRRPLLDYWIETGEDLYRLVRHVLIHEIGHHFGFSDEDMERLEAED